MEKTKKTLDELKQLIKDRNFWIQSVTDITNPLHDIEEKGIMYQKIDYPIEHEEDGFVDGYLLVDSLDGNVFIPFYKQGEVHGIYLKQPRLVTESDDLYLDTVIQEIENTVKTLRVTYNNIKKAKK
jgi:hypothetical protein